MGLQIHREIATLQQIFPYNDIQHCMGKFVEEWQFPYAFAAVDGSHLPIKCPNGRPQAMKLCFKRFLFDCFDGTSGCRLLIRLGCSRSSRKHT